MMASIWERVRALGLAQGFWALADQGVVSLGTFLTSILLARHLSPAQYGVYALIFSALFYFTSIHSAVIIYPLSVTGAATKAKSLSRLSGTSLMFTGALGLLLSVAMVAASIAAGSASAAPWAVATLICWLFQETVRRALMAHLRHRDALLGDAVSYLGQGILIWTLTQIGQVSLPIIFGVIALTSAFAAAIQCLQVGIRFARPGEIGELVRRFWNLGRWALFGSTLGVLSAQAYPWILAYSHGSVETAKFQALINVLGVSHPIMFGISSLVVPAVAQANHKNGLSRARRVGLTFGAQGAALLLPYFTLLVIWPRSVLSVFYGSTSPYTDLSFALRVMVIAYCFVYLSYVLNGLLNGIERARFAFMAQLFESGASLLLGLPATAWLGVSGAAAGRLLIGGVKAGSATFFVGRSQKPSERPAASL